MQYQIERSARRRTISITIKHGVVKVAAPIGVSERDVKQFVTSKEAWIARHLGRQQALLSNLSQRRWQYGETIRWLGKPLVLDIRPGTRNTIAAIDNTLNIRISRRSEDPNAQTQRLVRDWFKRQAMAWLDNYVPQLPAIEGRQPRSWRVANYHAKWGACSACSSLSFSWRLFIAPEWVVKYVVLHERCHLVHFNHSSAFWHLVERHDPHYQRAEQWLKDHGHSVLNNDYLDYHNS